MQLTCKKEKEKKFFFPNVDISFLKKVTVFLLPYPKTIVWKDCFVSNF